MKSINIKEFQKNIYLYINELPIKITRRGEVIAILQSPNKEVATTSPKVATFSQAIENKKELEVATCDKCKLECDPEEIKAHWEDGEEHKVCLYCLKKKKREPKKAPVSLNGVKMNDKMKALLSL